MNDNYILPKYWHIKITLETAPYIDKYREIKLSDMKGINLSILQSVYQMIQETAWACNENQLKINSVEISLDIFKKYVLKEDVDDFILPEKWVVKGIIPSYQTKEKRQLLPINIYLKKFDKYSDWGFTDDNYYYIDKNNNCTYFSIYLKSKNRNYIEITYNQFLKYVLKQDDDQIKSTNNTKTYTIDDIKIILKNNYDGDDVNDIIKIIENG